MDQPIPNLTLKEFEDGFGMINRDLLPEENIKVLVIKDNNVILNFELITDRHN